MNSTEVGKSAEHVVAELLEAQGHTIIAMNWRTRWCEIDIVSKTKDCVFFTEVKYRSNIKWGDGFDYITPKKLKQMHFAAEFWLSDNNWKQESLLQAASVDSMNEVEIVAI